MATLGDITWYRGDSFPIELTIKNKATRAAIDITGYSFLLTVNTVKDPADETQQIFQVAGVLDDDPTTGKVSFTPTTVDTDLDPATYYYDVQMTDADSNVRTVSKYKLKITQDITKS